MPSLQYMNQSAPFWDFIASLEQQGRSHPLFSQNQDEQTERQRDEEFHPFGAFGWGYPQGFPFRPPPQAAPQHESTSHEHKSDEDNEMDFEKEFEKELEKEAEKEKGKAAQDNDNGEGPANNSASDTEGCSRRRGGRPGRCGRGGPRHQHEHGFGGPREHWSRDHHHRGPPGPCGRGGWRGSFGPRHGPPHHGPHHHGRRGGWGSWGGRGGPFSGAPFNPFALAAGLFDFEGPQNNTNEDASQQDFSPEADIFDTPSSFVIHVSLPGAKKEDVGVNWDAEKSELSVAGVIYRPGDEEFLKTLAMDGRKVGPFERKIRLGTRANAAMVDAEGISAKLEDGILRIEVPKMGEAEFVEIRKVDIE